MLSLLCSSPRPDDYDFDHGSARGVGVGFKRPGRRMSLPGKKRVQKLSISGPTGFVHTSHIGHDQLGSGEMLSSAWASAGAGIGPMRAVSASAPSSTPHVRPQSQPPVLTHDVMHITRRASLPLSSSPISPNAPVAPVRRKPIPAYLDETANVSPFPSSIVSQAGQRDQGQYQQQYEQQYQQQQYYPHYHQQQQQQEEEESREPMRERQLVRLLDTLPEGRDVDNPMLVTQTTKARFDGAMREITQALRDP